MFDEININVEKFINQMEFMSESVNRTMENISSTISNAMGDLTLNLNEANACLATFTETLSMGESSQSSMDKGLLYLTTSMGLFTSALTIANAAQAVLNDTTKANPYIFVASAVFALIGALAVFGGSMDSTTSKHKETMEVINKEIDARNDLATKQQESANASISELNNVQNLNNELGNLIDSEGKVTAGNEARAAFIVSVLNKALGEQISIENGVITGYDKSSNAINDKIAKLKAEAILEAQLPAYKKALIEATNAQIKADEFASQVSDLKMQKKAKEAELEAQYGANWRKEAKFSHDMRLFEIIDLETQTKQKEDEFKKQDEITKGYYDDISLYETNAALISSGNAENYGKVQMESAVTKANSVEEKKIALENEINAETSHIERLKEMKALETDEEKQRQLQAQIDAANMNIAADQAEIDQMAVHGQQVAELKEVKNLNDLTSLGTFISEKQAKLAEMYATDESKWTEEQKKEAEALKASIDNGLASYSQFAMDKVTKATELSSKLNENSTQEEKDAAASAEREALETLKILGKNATDKLDILADLKDRRAAGDKSITDAMIKEAERQAMEAADGYGNVAATVNSSWDGMSKESRKAFEDVMKPMLEEMEKKQPGLFTKAAGIATGILDRLRKSFDINSPSRKVRKIFQSVMEGAEVGLDDGTPELMDQTEGIATNILDVFTTLNQSDIQALVHKMQSAMDSESMHMRGIVNSNFSQEMYATNKVKIEMPNLTGTIRGNIENHVMMDGRETAIQLSPFISEELAFTSR